MLPALPYDLLGGFLQNMKLVLMGFRPLGGILGHNSGSQFWMTRIFFILGIVRPVCFN